MAKQKSLICYPHLNDCKGDLTKHWYIEYSFRLPDKLDKVYRNRLYDNLCSGTADERYAAAKSMISRITEYLKSGEYLNHDENYNPVRIGDDYRPEQQAFVAKQKELLAGTLIPRFLKHIHPTIRPKTRMDYKGKLHLFQEYVEQHGNKTMNLYTRSDIMPFFEGLASERDLCNRSIVKYEQIVRAFFTWLEDMGIREFDTNPIKRMPKFGKIIDCASVPFDKDDRERLKIAISQREPYLWLACEFEYYCAIRPGTELRLAKVGMINRENMTITIPATLAKNKTTEAVTIPKLLMDEIERLGIFNYPKDFYIFGKYGIPGQFALGKNTMRNRFNYYREQLNISKDKKFYSWKHTGAISALTNGIPIQDLKCQLRHKSVTTTEVYVKRFVPGKDSINEYIDEI